MWLSIVLYTFGAVALTVQQFRYWLENGKGAEKWVALGWMGAAWLIGVLFLTGVKLPAPVKPLFPNWK